MLHLSKAENHDCLLTFLILTLIYYLPSLLFIQLQTSSLAPGLFLASLVVIALTFKVRYLKRINKKSFVYFWILSILLISTSIFLFYFTSNKKPLAAFVLITLAVSAFLFSQRIAEGSTAGILKGIYYFIVFTLVLGWLSYFNLSDFGSYATRYKPVAPFSEESHYALCIGFLAGAYSVVANFRKIVFITFNIIAQAILFPNLTLLVFVTLIIVILFARLNPKYFIATSTIIILALSNLLSFVITNNEYFASRLNFDESDNLTTLVWLQGWDLAKINFINTNGLGLGFQMLGSENTSLSTYSYLTEKIAGQYKNLEDGGFLAAKIIAELGIAGLLIVGFYIIYLMGFIRTLNNNNKLPKLFNPALKNEIHNLKKLFCQGLLFFFVVEFFLRGYGYFSPSLYMVLTGIFLLTSTKSKHEAH